MRLLHRSVAGVISLTQEFYDDIPPYAILSHTWGAEEVSIQDMKSCTASTQSGYEKIVFCGEQAQRDGLSYFWVDTCCIDKTSSAELAEAINSMFRWYRRAARCYVYLADVSRQSSGPLWEEAFRKSRWFTRGWTLQELLAPTIVEFYSKDRVLLGDKEFLEQHIHDATGIPAQALQGDPLEEFPVSERLAWIEKRETTRQEDKAYAMLGLFDVQMPLIYGEGREKAFERLLKEVNEATKPLSIPIANEAAFDSRAEEHNPQCHPDTRTDLLSQIVDWPEDPNGKPIYWLNGMAGTGKSTISRTVAQRFHKNNVLGASFFFKRGEADRGGATRFFTTLAAQLALRLPPIARHVRSALDADPSLPSKALREQFEKLILQPISKMRHPQTLVFVVDALDECNHDLDIKAIIYFFSQAKTLTSVRLKTFLTSRPDLPIRLGFTKIQGEYQDFVLHEIPSPVIDRDLRIFLEYELARIRNDYNADAFEDVQLPPDWPGQRISSLVRVATPLFIFAATICRFLEDPAWCDPDSQLQKLLEYEAEFHDSELDRLDGTYLPVLNQLVVDKTGPARKRLVDGFRGIVGAIVLLCEPLSASALSRLLDIPLATIQGQLKPLHSVLDVPSRADARIRTFHLSFRDFLVDPAKKGTNEFWVDERETHERLAVRCIQRLSAGFLKKDICGLRKPGMALSHIDNQKIDKNLPPEVQYACLYWVFHLERGKAVIQGGEQVSTFLKAHFLHWIEALCLLDKVFESLDMIKSLQRLSQPGTDIDAFLRDANRFIRNCIPIVSDYPLQLYSSAIFFSPENGIIRNNFDGEASTWILTMSEVDLEWNACIQTLEGHRHWVYSVAFSPDGRLLASGSGDSTVRIWDVMTGTCEQTLKGHGDGVYSLVFSRDGRFLASGSGDCTTKIWDTLAGTCVQTLGSHENWVSSVAFSPDARIVASASADCTIMVWDAVTGTRLHTIEGNDPYDQPLVYLNDSHLLAFTYEDHIIKIWDAVTGRFIQALEGPNNWVLSVGSSPDGRLLAAVSNNSTIQIWDAMTGTCLHRLEGHEQIISSAEFSPDGRLFASVTDDRVVKLWDVATGMCVKTLEGHSRNFLALTLSPDGHFLASASRDCTVKLWDTMQRVAAPAQEPEATDICVDGIGFSPDGRFFVSASSDCTIKVWAMVTGSWKCIQTLEGHAKPVCLMVFSPDGRILASASSDFTIKLWDTVTGSWTCKHTLEGHSRWVSLMGFSPDGGFLVSTSHGLVGYIIMVWDTASGSGLRIQTPRDNSICSVAFSPDNRLLASASASFNIRVWDVGDGTLQRYYRRIPTIGWTPQSIVFDSSGSHLYTESGTIDVGRDSDQQIIQGASTLPAEPEGEGYGLSSDDNWITRYGEKVLWLPAQYRPRLWRMAGSTIAMRYESGRVIFLSFWSEEPVA